MRQIKDLGVGRGQVVARMDTQDLAASLKKSQAQVLQAERAIGEANANVTQRKTQVVLARQEMNRAAASVEKGFQTKEVVDQRCQQLDGANAAPEAANAPTIELNVDATAMVQAGLGSSYAQQIISNAHGGDLRILADHLAKSAEQNIRLPDRRR